MKILKWSHIKKKKKDSQMVINEVSTASLGPCQDGHLFQFIGVLSTHLMH